MPTNRKRKTRQRVDRTMPKWAKNLQAGILPVRDSDEWGELIGWRYFGDAVPGLPNDWREKERLSRGQHADE